MALDLRERYGIRVDTTDPAYPYGKARNATAVGDGTGFPLERDWVNDLQGFLQALLVDADIAPSEVPDTANVSQYLGALLAIFYRRGQVDTLLANEVTARNAAITAAIENQFSGCSLYKSANQTLSSEVESAITFNSESWDVGDYHSTSSNTQRLVAPATGYYLLSWRVPFGSGAAGFRNLALYLNGSSVGTLDSTRVATTTTALLSGCMEFPLTAADYIEVRASQNSGGDVDVVGGVWGTRVSLRRIDPIVP
jgi:hypothetical protein